MGLERLGYMPKVNEVYGRKLTDRTQQKIELKKWWTEWGKTRYQHTHIFSKSVATLSPQSGEMTPRKEIP